MKRNIELVTVAPKCTSSGAEEALGEGLAMELLSVSSAAVVA